MLIFLQSSTGLGKLFEVMRFERKPHNQFSATIRVLGSDGREAEISHETNAGMRRFELKPAHAMDNSPHPV